MSSAPSSHPPTRLSHLPTSATYPSNPPELQPPTAQHNSNHLQLARAPTTNSPRRLHTPPQERRVDVLEFEYKLSWGQQMGRDGLRNALTTLSETGYYCFWQGWIFHGALAEASGACWQSGFNDFHPMSWGNLVCSHRPDILTVFRSLRPPEK
mmetsp:Transcript_37518/g.85134  ORF Transcript_37518/g.85134 Transcript_37518/m.85134 type:complete len:153 (-) Transcript_37518:272-730(-)|eukprot:CAMPEP_0181197602 /NCGR_PEP_ID=MMETSP1096-20121128/16136_1 /TAXON_ID=156174 ORGANISM="Chrysochromulina ericina, Strain CCMP281" /NCGR_SAMPLE_ID=MMETSP1096 /ASSEMBLY_ACC=CAM_ASM_000453 /LENGTH=152 /DNA_ID=CAMNT_0023287539 /DNA_START=254 /DNA_END=712 /DNA_ORIENTATION=+